MSLSALNILVVEDHGHARAGLAMILDALGHRYEMACDADEAFSMAASTRFDGLLTDVYLPRVSGWRLVRQLRMNCHLPARVVSMSGGSEALETLQSSATGCHMHLCKPFDLEELTAALSQASSSERVMGPLGPPRPKDRQG